MDHQDAAMERLKSCGLSVTPQRLAIYLYLLGSKDHPDAERIYNDLGKLLPSMSLATVYKTLDTLVKHNLIRVLNPLNEKVRYDAQLSPHQHLVCDVCGEVRDLEVEPEGLYGSGVFEEHDFTPRGYNIHIFGQCGRCLRENPSGEKE